MSYKVGEVFLDELWMLHGFFLRNFSLGAFYDYFYV